MVHFPLLNVKDLQQALVVMKSRFLLLINSLLIPQALPMVTLFVGRRNGTQDECNIRTLCQGADEPFQIQFSTKNLCPGLPK